MSHVLQVGAGSGGVVVLDLLARDPSVTHVSLVDYDVYEPHNVHRHLFPPSAVGRLKSELAAEWVRSFRSDISIQPIIANLTDPARHDEFASLAAACDVGVCAVDSETAKYAFDTLMRAAGKPWTLGEVLSGGIGGWVHRFIPGGACYGCVASHLQRTVREEPQGPTPDYSNPGGAIPETTIPANKASISVIASLHATVTLEMLKDPTPQPPPSTGEGEKDSSPPSFSGKGVGGLGSSDFTSLLFTLARVPGVFEDAFRTYRFRIPRSPVCLVCGKGEVPAGDLDVALGEALDRLGPR